MRRCSWRKAFDLRMIMRILGYSAIAVTGNLYTHVKLDTQRTALDKLTGLFDNDAVAVTAAVNGPSLAVPGTGNEEPQADDLGF